MAIEQNDLPYTLRAIYLRSSEVRLAPHFDPTLPAELAGEFRMLGGNAECRTQEMTLVDGSKQTSRTCVFTSRFEFRYVDPKTMQPGMDKAPALATIAAEITTDYLFNGQVFPDAETLHAWGQSNVLLHAWPYWREYLHNTLARMQLPVTVMPLLRLEPKPVEEEKTKPSPRKRKASKKAEAPSPAEKG